MALGVRLANQSRGDRATRSPSKLASGLRAISNFLQRFIDCLLPISHIAPLAGHIAIGGLDPKIGNPFSDLVTFDSFLPVEI